ncbi:MAG: DUF1801 domain-containing protein [Ginsengibacter sp.]
MEKNKENSKADFYFTKEKKWTEEILKLRAILLSCDLEEDLKWGVPCYTWNDHNIVLIHVFKNYCALLFVKGALLKDEEQILVQQTENVQSARHLRFQDMLEINQVESIIKDYVQESIDAEKSGLKVALKGTKEYQIPEELANAFAKNNDFKKAFQALTPGRQRGYLLYFSAAKQVKTRQDRIEKHTRNIMEGKGLND